MIWLPEIETLFAKQHHAAALNTTRSSVFRGGMLTAERFFQKSVTRLTRTLRNSISHFVKTRCNVENPVMRAVC